MIPPAELDGKVALVTGGARGIGRGIALKLAQAGADVVINYLEREDAAHEVADWVKGMGHRCLLAKADVCDGAQVHAMFETITAEFGRLDILVNNVGPFFVRRILKMSVEEWRLMIEANLTSAFQVAREAAPLIDRGEMGGSIVFIGAPNAERVGSQSETCAYSIAKTGVVILALTLARDLGPQGIRVNVVNPGFIENDSMTPRMREWMPHEVPLRKIGTPANVADAVLFLVSDRGAYVNGAVFNIHGGLWV
ncbi:SDR family oxidoreductase [bacterium]|nr:SDR family oxidoreductase [bacterium]MBU1984899.1 SDR family oxidoreductase [bacterium]